MIRIFLLYFLTPLSPPLKNKKNLSFYSIVSLSHQKLFYCILPFSPFLLMIAVEGLFPGQGADRWKQHFLLYFFKTNIDSSFENKVILTFPPLFFSPLKH